ncbi:MAG: 3'-5' exonuclease [Chloroflexi bacterium]|nr:3'-5' exonuclease [Chloroflexota bacterium]
MSRYAVVDIETTGILPELHHKIVEVAVVLADDRGQPVREWETLINPVRDVGATEIHGITAADVYSAPTFDQVAPELASLLRGKVIVAHNLSFDAHFLSVEFARAGYAVGFGRTTGLCTMRLASHYLPIGARSLGAAATALVIASIRRTAHCATPARQLVFLSTTSGRMRTLLGTGRT